MRTLFLSFFFLFSFLNISYANIQDKNTVEELLLSAEQANEALRRSDLFVRGWLNYCDEYTGLIPRNLLGDCYWNAKDAAADNYPYMVLTSFFTDRNLFNGRMKDILASEIRFTSRLGDCPDTFDFIKRDFKNSVPDVGDIIFGSAEYVKDGLLPLTEWLGVSPWSDRMVKILDQLYKILDGDYVKSVKNSTLNGMAVVEANGDLLQALSRMYWMTGKQEYLQWAMNIADFYLLNDKGRLLNNEVIRLRDHGGEIVLGLCELYVTLNFIDLDKKSQYKLPLYEVMDTIIRYATNSHGMLYNSFNPRTGEIIDVGLADTWGYIFDGFYAIYLVDKHEPYKDIIVKAMGNLNKYYRSYDWENGSHDGYADAIESAINLYNRLPIESVAEWIDSEIKIMFNKQRKDGVIEGWHGDGNFARTSIMYALWKSLGSYVTNWDEDLLLSGKKKDGSYLFLLKSTKTDWSGKLCFDPQRHKRNLRLPIDWTRINQFPEWFTPVFNLSYLISINGSEVIVSGEDLCRGLDLQLKKGESLLIEIKQI